MKIKISYYLLIAILLASMNSCKKSELLDAKPNSNIVVPTTLEDLTNLLDNTDFINQTPALPTMSSDEYFYASESLYDAISTNTEKNAYIWKKDIYGGETKLADWNNSYQSILYSNIVLEGVSKLPLTEQNSEKGRLLMGWAYFIRAYNNFNLVQTFSNSYNKSSASNDLGVPIRLSAGIDELTQRSTVQQTYDQLLLDAEKSVSLLPSNISTKNLNRPSKPAAYAFLSRVFLSMRDYTNALKYADSSLTLYDKLIDYNSLDINADAPLAVKNPETLMQSTMNSGYYNVPVVGVYSGTTVDTLLMKTYDQNDLRLKFFFQTTDVDNKTYYLTTQGYTYRNIASFTGLAVDELYLIKAECLVRTGDIINALLTINSLLKTRYVTNTYVAFTSSDEKVVLNKILLERRKELLFRGLRWSDLKRLNLEGANITLTRTLNGKTYILPPNSPLYIFPIPDDEIMLSHLVQNQR